ncbi:MAG TPA: cellulase family glycosylhydrolase, partial [Candidatus Acidoferrales bacterium]|nr:cellulase family glycosylhydrolase [Candidatus Acidoferrales bacterium]
VVSTELINYYSMTTAEIQKFITTLHDQGITTLTVRINSYNEYTSDSNTAIAKIKAIIPVANAQGISVNVDLHTWYTTWDNNFRDSASNAAANRNTYINYVKTTIAAFNGYNVKAFMVLNEPQARTASTSENNFILSIISAANTVTDKPISVRFMAGYSPSTGHYSSAIDTASDFLSRNTYWDARSPTSSVYGCTEAKLLTAISTAHSQNKELWITEFGKSNSNLADQQAYVKSFVAYAKSKGIDQIFCWVSQPESSGETYNIFNGYTPNPAFYELVNTASSTNPTATPTPAPTATATPKPTATPTPTTTPKPTSTTAPTPTASPSTSPIPTPTPTPTATPSPSRNWQNYWWYHYHR